MADYMFYGNDRGTVAECSDGNAKAEWVNLGEGVNGDYDPVDPDDENLLRFNVYVNDGGWVEIPDASYCSNMPATASPEMLEASLRFIFERYSEVLVDYPRCSAGSLGEELSWLSPADFA